MRIVTKIARLAQQKLGRAAYPRRYPRDYQAWDAVRDAAHECGFRSPLLRYVTDATSLTAMARAYVGRYVQAYGPAENIIDAGAHIGSRMPRPIELDAGSRAGNQPGEANMCDHNDEFDNSVYRIEHPTCDGRAWRLTYECVADAMCAICDELGWDVDSARTFRINVVVDRGDEHNAWCVYESQAACDADEDGAHAPRIVED